MDSGFKKNEVLEKLPSHLLDFVIDQPYNGYTAQDHAVWRYVMRQNVNFLGRVAHDSYLNGLKQTGISIDSIPHMYGMNRILKDIGWAAVAVDGFIPPQAFMEFQAYKVLVIAADIRNIGNIKYTPAPDIIHEAAGHAPIIADAEYAHYLKRFGEIGCKAFSSKKDYELYEAIRHLSIIKENPNTDLSEVAHAEKEIEWLQQNMGAPSEMAKIRNLHWWTVEYGLIGSVDDYKLYGAGLLSSIGESANCMKAKVKKLPYTLDAVNYGFDITTEQPQLFVTPSFKHLNKVLDEFADTMASRRGGSYGLETAVASNNLSTLCFGSIFEVSGTPVKGTYQTGTANIEFADKIALFANQESIFIKEPTGKTVFLLNDAIEVNVQGTEASVKLGGKSFTLLNVSKYEVQGVQIVTGILSDGTFFIVIKSTFELTSAYSGPANPKAWGLHYNPPKEKTLKITYNEKAQYLHKLYHEVRDIRDGNKALVGCAMVFEKIQADYPKEWLLPLEIYEILSAKQEVADLRSRILEHLNRLRETDEQLQKLIDDGLRLISEDFNLIHA